MDVNPSKKGWKFLVNDTAPLPLFLVNVADKGLSVVASGLESTVAGERVSVVEVSAEDCGSGGHPKK